MAAKIADPNLRLTILQAAWTEGLIPKFDKEAFFRDELGEEYDGDADYNYEPHEKVLQALLKIPLPDSVLTKLKNVVWDGGNDIFLIIWRYWDGESDEFNVKDLSGIEACKNLEMLAFTAGADFTDCSPVAELKKLNMFMDRGTPLKSLKPLLPVPKLKKVDAAYEPTAENKKVLAELKKRGVEVVE